VDNLIGSASLFSLKFVFFGRVLRGWRLSAAISIGEADVAASAVAFSRSHSQLRRRRLGSAVIHARFGSKELSIVVDQALENTNDIAAAVARIAQATRRPALSSSRCGPR